MVAVIVRHRVTGFDTWKPVFDEHGEVRRRHGALGHRLYQVGGDRDDVLVVNLFRDEAGARGFMADPSLPEVMQRAGVAGPPEILVCDEVEVADYQVPVG